MCNRIEKYGEWEVSIAENITFDDKDAKEIVFNMIIDDGNPSRGHRKNLFNKDFTKIGVAVGHHTKYKHVTVVNFAVNYSDKQETQSKLLKAEKAETEVVYRRRTTIA